MIFFLTVTLQNFFSSSEGFSIYFLWGGPPIFHSISSVPNWLIDTDRRKTSRLLLVVTNPVRSGVYLECTLQVHCFPNSVAGVYTAHAVNHALQAAVKDVVTLQGVLSTSVWEGIRSQFHNVFSTLLLNDNSNLPPLPLS